MWMYLHKHAHIFSHAQMELIIMDHVLFRYNWVYFMVIFFLRAQCLRKLCFWGLCFILYFLNSWAILSTQFKQNQCNPFPAQESKPWQHCHPDTSPISIPSHNSFSPPGTPTILIIISFLCFIVLPFMCLVKYVI